MHPRQASLLDDATTFVNRVAATVLWKYADPEGRTFYLEEKRVTVRSPYDGKSMSAKPERMSMSDVGQGLKEDAKSKKAADEGWKVEAAKKRTETKPTASVVLWQYTCPETDKTFWMPEKKTRAFSPWSGKAFSAKPERDTMSEVAKEVKEDSKKPKATKKASDDFNWKV